MEIDGAGYGENIRIDESIIGDDIADGACASETPIHSARKVAESLVKGWTK